MFDLNYINSAKMRCEIYVKDLDGNTTRVDLDVDSEEELKSTTVEEFRRRFIPEDEDDLWRLLYADKQLDHDRTLGDYGISNKCVMHMVKRLRGGGNITAEDPPPDAGKGVPRTDSMDKLANMQQDSSGWCCIM